MTFVLFSLLQLELVPPMLGLAHKSEIHDHGCQRSITDCNENLDRVE